MSSREELAKMRAWWIEFVGDPAHDKKLKVRHTSGTEFHPGFPSAEVVKFLDARAVDELVGKMEAEIERLNRLRGPLRKFYLATRTENRNLKTEIEHLESLLTKAMAALEFYGDDDNWTIEGPQKCPAITRGEDITNHPNYNGKFTAGKIARETLAEILKEWKCD